MVRFPSFTRHDQDADRAAADQAIGERDRQARADDRMERARARAAMVERPGAADEPTVVQPAPTGRPRASLLATLSLLFGVLAAAGVATGVLAAPAIAVGVIGGLLAVGGLTATGKPNVAGRFDALFGLLLSLAAIIVGLLALGNAIPWPDTDTNQVARFSDWLKEQIPWLARF